MSSSGSLCSQLCIVFTKQFTFLIEHLTGQQLAVFPKSTVWFISDKVSLLSDSHVTFTTVYSYNLSHSVSALLPHCSEEMRHEGNGQVFSEICKV